MIKPEKFPTTVFIVGSDSVVDPMSFVDYARQLGKISSPKEATGSMPDTDQRLAMSQEVEQAAASIFGYELTSFASFDKFAKDVANHGNGRAAWFSWLRTARQKPRQMDEAKARYERIRTTKATLLNELVWDKRTKTRLCYRPQLDMSDCFIDLDMGDKVETFMAVDGIRRVLQSEWQPVFWNFGKKTEILYHKFAGIEISD